MQIDDKLTITREDVDNSLIHDGWSSVLSSVSSRLSRDKRLKDLSGTSFSRLPYNICEDLYAKEPLARKIVRLPLDYGMLNGWRFQIKGKSKEEILEWEEKLHIETDDRFNLEFESNRAMEYGRIYGAGYLILNINDGRHFQEPLDLNNIKSIKWIKSFTPHELIPFKTYGGPDSKYLEPDYYTFAHIGAGGVYSNLMGKQIHHSRIIRFDGVYLPRMLYISNGYQHDSVLNPVYDELDAYNYAMEAAAYIINEFSIGVYKIKNLASQLASTKAEANLIKRLMIVDQTKSLNRAVMVDADKESYDRISGRFAGVSEVISKLEKRLVAVSGIPHNLLFSEAGGHEKSMFSNSGDSEWSEWETSVHSFRKNYLIRGLNQLYKLVFSDKSLNVTKGKAPDFKIFFSGQRKLNEMQEAEIYASISQTDNQNIDSGIMLPEEVRKTRYGQGGTFSDLSIRVELDDKAFEDSKKLKEKQAQQFQENQPPDKDQGDEKPEDQDKKPENKGEKTLMDKIKNGIRFRIKDE